MDVRTDYYAALGLQPPASPDEIRHSSRVLARRFHPDTSSAADAQPRFQQVQDAYEILSDPEKKRAYDQWREKEGLAEPPALVVRHTLSRSKLAILSEDQILYDLVEIFPSSTLDVKRLPFNLCLVIDRSTSMQGLRLQRVKDATNFIIDFLDESDIFSMVIFSDWAEVVIPAQSKLDKNYAKSRVSTIRSSGGTEILQGMVAGLAELDRWRSPDTVSHLILLTDGQTYGGESECVEQAIAAGKRQISITAMGIGQDWNDKLMDEIARQSGGTSTYIDSAARVTSLFRECIQSLSSVVARDLNLTLRLGEGVSVHSAFRVSPRLEPLQVDQSLIRLGQLGGEQPCSLMLELLVAPHSPAKLTLAKLEVAATVPALAHRHQVIKKDIDVEFAEDLEVSMPAPPNIVSTLGKLAIFKMQEKTMEDLERGQIDRASQRLETMATRLLNIGENDLAKAALLEAGRLARTGHISPEGRKRIRYGTRGLSVLPKEVSRD